MNRNLQKKLLLSCSAVVAFEILLTVVNTVVEKASAGAVGLDGIHSRAIMDTVRLLLQEIGTFLLPFWQIGVIRAALCHKRGERLDGCLTFGFHRFGPVFGTSLILGLLMTAVLTTVLQVSGIIFQLTPMGREAMLHINSQIAGAEDPVAALLSIPLPQLIKIMGPALVLALVLGIPAVYLVGCRFRMVNYLIMEDKKYRAFPAVFLSAGMTKGQAGNFLRLDLKFWWYYLLMALIGVMTYGDLLLLQTGLKADATVLLFAVVAVRSALRLAMAWFLQSKVELAYAGFYEKLYGYAQQPENEE